LVGVTFDCPNPVLVFAGVEVVEVAVVVEVVEAGDALV